MPQAEPEPDFGYDVYGSSGDDWVSGSRASRSSATSAAALGMGMGMGMGMGSGGVGAGVGRQSSSTKNRASGRRPTKR